MTAYEPLLVIFDLDGTLVDSAGDICLAVNGLLQERGAEPLSVETVREFVGEGARRLVEKLLQVRPAAGDDVDSVLTRFLAIYEEMPTTHTVPYPGVRATLDRLVASGASLAVCTNKPSGPTANVLRDLDLAHFFRIVIAGDTLPVRKPDPVLIETIASRLGFDMTSAVLVGDSEVDAATAAAAGIPFVLMTYGYHHSPVEAIPATHRLDQFAELMEILPLRAG
jgi:phosphoglycolate phosphatase